MTGFKLIFFKLYIFFLALWMGGNAFTTLSIADTWYEDPVTYIDHITAYPVSGATDPIATLNIILSITAVLSMLTMLAYHGPGKRSGLISCISTFLIMLATYLYFDPTYSRLFDDTGTFNNQVIPMSRTWIILNYIRLFFTVVSFYLSLIALSKFKERRIK